MNSNMINNLETPQLETERLMLSKIRNDDVSAIFECWMKDEEVSKYMFWKASDDINEAKEFVKYEMDNINNAKWKRWIIQLKSTGEIIGTGLFYFNLIKEVPHFNA